MKSLIHPSNCSCNVYLTVRISRTVLIVWKLLRPLFMFSTFSHLIHTIYAPTILSILSILSILATLSILSIYTIQYPYYLFFPYYIISIHPSFQYYPYCPNSKTHGHALKSYFWVSFITVFGAFWMWFPLIFLWGTMFYLKKTTVFQENKRLPYTALVGYLGISMGNLAHHMFDNL